jgi:precorrin-6B methylase 2
VALKKHVNANQVVIAKNVEEEVNNHVKGVLEKQQTEKLICLIVQYQKKLGSKYSFKNNNVQHINSCKTLAF